MPLIRILPDQLANQIAAGEVVERPASVVKELLENSLDAKASRIEIDIEGSGTRLIRVVDDGQGMDEDDLLLSLERHGTSKISTEADLAAIGSLGFRGEALPSIGSVSHLSLTSRRLQAELGNRVELQYGKLVKAHEIGCGHGTTVEVRHLFGNTPARRKFLRTARTELGHIEEVVKNYALAAPNITFVLRVDGRDSLFLDNTRSLKQRLAAILHHTGALIPVDTVAPANTSYRVSGFLVPPEQVSAGPARLRIFVNGRAVRDRMIAHAVTEGLRGFLMKGKNPSGLIHLHLPPGDVDVNVHPAKHEVRFRYGKEVHGLLSLAVAQTMRHQQVVLKEAMFTSTEPAPTTAIPAAEPPARPSRPEQGETPAPPPPGGRKAAGPWPTATPPSSRPPAASVTAARQLFATAEPLRRSSPEHEVRSSPPQSTPSPSPRPTRHNLVVIGQYDDLYIFCKNDQGLLVIDQHAAHERVLFEKLRRQYLDGRIARQTLMFPESVELTVFQRQLVEKNEAEIARLGFAIRDFGHDTYIISAVPALAGTTDPRQLFLDALERFGSEQTRSDTGGALDSILATMACKAAVKAGTELSRPEIDSLLSEMAGADLFSHCPHGRPVVKQFTREEVKRWFHRS